MYRKKNRQGVPSLKDAQRTDESLMSEVVQLFQGVDVPSPCSSFVTSSLATLAEELAENLTAEAEGALDDFDGWPDDPRTREMRTLLAAFAEEAERDAAKWAAFAQRVAAAEGKLGHVHIVDGKLVDGDEAEAAEEARSAQLSC